MTPFSSAAIAHADSRLATGTRELYKKSLQRWLTFCTENNADPITPTKELVSKFRDELKNLKTGEKLEAPTIRLILTSLSSMYENALDSNGKPIATWNPFKKFPRPPAVSYGLTEVVPEDVVQAVLAEASTDKQMGVRDVAVILLLHETGLRISSITNLKRSDIFRRNGQLMLRVVVKGGKKAEVEVPEKAGEALEKWLEACKSDVYVFPNRMDDKPISYRAINKRLDYYTRKAGIEHVHPHQFRAAYITTALDAGVALHEIQASVHHANSAVTSRYDRGIRGKGVTSAVSKFREGKKDA